MSARGKRCQRHPAGGKRCPNREPELFVIDAPEFWPTPRRWCTPCVERFLAEIGAELVEVEDLETGEVRIVAPGGTA